MEDEEITKMVESELEGFVVPEHYGEIDVGVFTEEHNGELHWCVYAEGGDGHVHHCANEERIKNKELMGPDSTINDLALFVCNYLWHKINDVPLYTNS